MSRIVARPEAILDASSNPADILHPGSDAARYVLECRVFPQKFLELLDDVPGLSNPDAIRLAGSVGSPRIAGRALMTIAGEPEEERIRYGFDVMPESVDKEDDTAVGQSNDDVDRRLGIFREGRLLRISRLTGRKDEQSVVQTLGLVGLTSSGGPVFYSPDKLDDPSLSPVEGPAVKHEFIQIIAAGADAVEWAFD